MLTHQIQKSLGSASLVLDGGALYATNGKWIIAFLQPAEVADEELLNWLVKGAIEQSPHAKWELLTAKNIDYSSEKFIRPRARKYEDMRDTDSLWSRARWEAKDLGDLLDRWCIDDSWNVTEAYQNGAGHLTYLKPKREGKANTAPVPDVITFNFDGRVLAVDGGWFTSLDEMGAEIFCPKNADPCKGNVGPPILWVRGESYIGAIAPRAESGILKDPQGRDLYGDAAVISWRTDAQDYEDLVGPKSYALRKDGYHLQDILSNMVASSVRRAVGSLRWKGLDDKEIEDIYESQRGPAYESLYVDRIKLVEQIYREVLEARSNANDWRWRNLRTQTERVCAEVEFLQKVWDPDLSLGQLPELVTLVGE